MSHRVTSPVIQCDFGACSAHLANEHWFEQEPPYGFRPPAGWEVAGRSGLLGDLHLCPLHSWAASAWRALRP